MTIAPSILTLSISSRYMHSGALRALEFERIVEAVCRFAQTPLGGARLARLQPESDPKAVAAALAATSETVRFLADNHVGLQAPGDLEALLTALAVEGRAIEPTQLLGLAAFLSSVDATCAAIRRGRSPFPVLRAIADDAAGFDQEIASIRRKIDPSGEVVDAASPELKSIRERLRKQRARLRGTLESYLRGKDTAKYLQQQIVTDRNGRYVLVVRSEHRSAIPGIVHGSSGTGASLFLEPLSTVEINNDIVALEQQERQEVHRILVELANEFRRRGADLQRTVDAATEIDVLQARARLSSLVDGVQPAVAADGRLELRAARHPLLIPGLRRHLGETPRDAGANDTEASPVPVDVLLIPPVRVLVITGPNTGGKTVALKTAGLLALMAQAGLLIPAAGGSQMTIFRSVFADIGDEQSIADNLSTFSGHIANIVSMDRALATPSLVLLDEAGAGTDPVEGGALAMAMIDHFRLRGALVVATTHFDALKSYASTTEGVTSAGFGFDAATFAPTYRLNYGSPGSSLALEIAMRLGLPASIIDAARAYRGAREAQLAEHLARVERDMQALDHERRLVTRERETVSETAARLQAREQELRNREETFRRRLEERIEERLREARRDIDAVVDALKARTDSMAADAERRAARLIPTGQTGAARQEARAAIDAIGERLRNPVDRPVSPAAAAAAPATVDRTAAIGDRVLVGGFGLEGVVKALHDREAEVDVRGKRLRARLDEIRVLAVGAQSAAPARVRVNVELQPRDTSLSELNVIGCTVDEAVTATGKFLDGALLGELRTVRVIHGYGTGQLRRALAEFLQAHPFVAHFAPAPAEKGGGGVTVVDLKD
ncbi:MAG TPA: Smr/MutS family protein [Vicinamibacterales bacterium]|nr:Smr/MutS family protein [Vicinamibacterales bacterium]